MAAEKLLLVDDDPGILRALSWSLDRYELVTASDRASAVEMVRRHRPKVVTLDLGLPPEVDEPTEGLAALDEILSIVPTTKVIVVSGQEDRANAVAAVGRGAADFYSKPIDAEILGLIVERAFHVHALEEENRRLRAERRPDGGGPLQGIITASPTMLEACRMVEKVAATEASVLLAGESGTGKELVARALHVLSGRRGGPFVAINCAAIPDALLESELFGYEKGAFTGAVRQAKGKVELAAGGTLFLDEIGDMPGALQAKLLRFLQERQIERLGGHVPVPVDVRVVSATHRDLGRLIEEGRFREDLYYRLAQILVTIPPLRERDGDAALIARHLVERFAVEQRKRPPRLSPGAVRALRNHTWPGNVRELENRVRRAVILDEAGEIAAADLDLAEPAGGTPDTASGGAGGDGTMGLRQARDEAERRAVAAALRRTGGNLTAAARILEVSRPTLYSLLRQHGLALPGEAAAQDG